MNAEATDLQTKTPVPAHTEEAETRVYIRPSLNRDLSALMAILLVIITYHIQHPTLLLRSQFGRSFRGESLQEAVSIGLVMAGFFLVDAWRKTWQQRDQPLNKLRLALAVGVGIYIVHNLLSIWQGFNIFHEIYKLDPAFLEDNFREDTYVNPVKALNGMALATGAALASVLYLWSPWELRQPRSLRRNFGAFAALMLIVAIYILQHPILANSTNLGEKIIEVLANVFKSRLLSFLGLGDDIAGLEAQTAVFAIFYLLILTLAWLILPSYKTWSATPSLNYHKLAMIGILGVYLFYLRSAIFYNDNFFYRYYEVDQNTYSELFTNSRDIRDALRAFDLNAMLAGMAIISIFYLMAPWERLNVYGDVIHKNAAPLIIALAFIDVWEGAIRVFEIQQFLLPRPTVIWVEFKEEYPKLIASGWFTFQNALFGFLIGCGAGILTGVLSARFTHFSRAVLPLAIAANSVPIIAFAPIANVWFGVTSLNSKIAIVAVLCYFPAMISTVRGLTSVQPIQLELMRSYAATELEIFRALRVPTALPLIFSALKLSTTLAMIGALVSEFFGGSLAGLGYRIREDAALFRFPTSWAAIVVASLFGISFYILISALERAAMPWYGSFRSDSR